MTQITAANIFSNQRLRLRQQPIAWLWTGLLIIGSISNLLLISKTNRILFGRQPDSDVTPHQRKLPQARSIKRIVIESIPRLPREEPFHSIKKKVEESSSTAIIANDQSKKDDFFSFCLLIKDDNDILNEWIAYHYHTIKLRKLIVAVDPSSKTSPLEILQIWQKFFGLEFEIWNDKDFMPDYFLDGQYENVPRMIKVEDKNATKWQDDKDAADEEHLRQDYVEINNHRYRQAKFLQACSKSLQLANNTWTTHIDTDEYIVVNPTLRQYEKVGINETVPVPTTLESGTIFNFLQDLLVDDKVVINWPCISMPRVLYGSLEDPYDEKDDKIVFDTFRRSRFESLRWKYHVAYDNATLNKQPKVIMDMSGFPPFNITRKAFSIHRPNMQLCRRQTQMDVENNWRYPLTVNHYVGSLERYNARDDPRRTQNAYREKASVRDGKDDGWIDTWLQSFVQEHGIGRVEQVLYRYLSNRVPPMKVEQADQKQADQPLMLGKVLPLEQDSFSGCLLLKDDSDILNEWIAYHYHVIKLRTLVVAIDPSSQTSPSVVFDRWRDLVEIVEWTDENFMPEFFLNKQYDLVPNMIGNMTNSSTSQFHKDDVELDQRQVQQELQDINNHRFRQATFFGSCIRELRQQNKTWMLHVDSDEYMVLHHEIKQQNHWRNLTLDPEIRPNSILEFLKGAAVRYPKAVNYPCISMPRLLFGAKEDDENDAVRLTNIPKPFDGKKFETVRWKYHTNFDKDVKINGKPKVIMDLSGIPPQSNFISKDIFSIHRPGMRLCRGDKRILFEKKTWFPITVNHYLGSWERYNHRDDARRNRRLFDAKDTAASVRDNEWIDSWVQSFIQEYGEETASKLLAEYVKSSNNGEEEQAAIQAQTEEEVKGSEDAPDFKFPIEEEDVIEAQAEEEVKGSEDAPDFKFPIEEEDVIEAQAEEEVKGSEDAPDFKFPIEEEDGIEAQAEEEVKGSEDAPDFKFPIEEEDVIEAQAEEEVKGSEDASDFKFPIEEEDVIEAQAEEEVKGSEDASDFKFPIEEEDVIEAQAEEAVKNSEDAPELVLTNSSSADPSLGAVAAQVESLQRDTPISGNVLPNILLIGAPKAGSTSIGRWLYENGVCPPAFFDGEPEYYSHEVQFFDQQSRYEQGLDFYSKRFQHCRSRTFAMDATPNTLSFPGHVENIYKEAGGDHLKNLKVIVVLREPVSRELSFYNHKVAEYLQTKDRNQWYSDVSEEDGSVLPFEDHAENLLRDIQDPGDWGLEWGMADVGLYAHHLSRWLKFIDRKNLLAISYDEFKNDNKAVEDRVRNFLGLSFEGSLPYTSSHENHHEEQPTCIAQAKLNALFEPLNRDLFKILDDNLGHSAEQRPFPSFQQLECTGTIPAGITFPEVLLPYEYAPPLQSDGIDLDSKTVVKQNNETVELVVPGSVMAFDASKRSNFSACLLTKDDNDILNEWIAYHYHVLGLRYLVVAVDAKSETSPTSLLDKWRKFGMTIEEWKDEMFMPDIYFKKAYHLQPRLVKIKKNKNKWLEGVDDPEVHKNYYKTIQDHRFRQITFLSSCTKRLREQNQTWMVHIDTDEYIVINPLLRQQQKLGESITIPETADASIVPRLLNAMVVSNWDTINYPCISLPRLLFGSIEDDTDERESMLPKGFNLSHFESLRWKYHTEYQDSDLNKQPKVIMDVSAIAEDDKMLTENRVFSIHRPSQFLCRNQGQMYFEDVEYFPFSVNHYVGTFERFGARDDPRRNKKLYDLKANVKAKKDDFWINNWLNSFVDKHGMETASDLLENYLVSN